MAKEVTKKIEPLKDTDLVQNGKYTGKRLIDVPAHWFLWMWEQPWFQRATFEYEVRLREYIKENMEVLKKQQKEANPRYK